MAGWQDWLDERTGWRAAWRWIAYEHIPGGARMQYVFGSVLLYLFAQQVVLGILLASYYSPSATDAWASTAYLTDQVTGGWFLRGLHHHGSSAMVVVVALHFLQVTIAGAYRSPRELNWWTGLAMAGIVLAFALTGYLLPWDQKGYWATQVATGIIGTVPGGEPLRVALQGGTEYGNFTLTRFYVLHVFVLPITLILLLAVHLVLFRRHGVTPPASLSEQQLRRTQMFWPYQVFYDVLAMAVCGGVLVILTVRTHGAELFAPADPASDFVARPEWYFLFLFQLLKYFNGPLQIVATVILPGAVSVGLLALPFVDRAPNRRIRSRMPVLGFVGLLMAGVVTLTTLALAEDAANHSYQKGLEAARKDAERTRELALVGVLPEGGNAVWWNDPRVEARMLFKEHCSTCHSIDGVGGEEAPDFTDYSSRAWLYALVRNPQDIRFFGGTKHHEMEPQSEEALPDDTLRPVIEYVYSLMGPEAGPVDERLVSRGKRLWDDGDVECSNCHEVQPGETGDGPNLAGHGSRAWVERVIADSGAPDLFGNTAEMPKFAGKLTKEQIGLLSELMTAEQAMSDAAP